MNQIFLRAAAVAATAVVVAGCSSATGTGTQRSAPAVSPSTTQAAPMAARNVEAPIQDIPWSQVGPGWMLAMWNAARPTDSGSEVPRGRADAV